MLDNHNILMAIAILLTIILLKLLVSSIEKRSKKTKEENDADTFRIMNQPSNNTTLSPLVDVALDEYEKQGIRLPLDIIEEISFMEFNNVDEVIKMIEHQRTNWKFENQKKLLRR